MMDSGKNGIAKDVYEHVAKPFSSAIMPYVEVVDAISILQ